MPEPLAVISDIDTAFRDLLRAMLEPVGYRVIDTASSAQLALVVSSKAALTAPRVFLAAAANLAVPCGPGIAALGRGRAGAGLPVPHTVLTFEFGTARDSAKPSFAACVSAGHLEKPFDLALLQSIATRCRSFPAGAEARLIGRS